MSGPILAAGNTSGYVGIGTTNPLVALHVVGQIYATNDITAFYSDERLKTRLKNITNALDKINTLEGFIYKNNEIANKYGFIDTKERVGVSAQAVQRVLPEAVCPVPFDTENASGSNYLTVQYDKLTPLLIEGIKELTLKFNLEVEKTKRLEQYIEALKEEKQKRELLENRLNMLYEKLNIN